MSLCGNKDLVQMLVQYPLHMSVNPVRWIKSFLRSQDHVYSSQQYQKALEQSQKLTPERLKLKIAAQLLRHKYSHAQQINEKLETDWYAWYNLSVNEQQLWFLFNSGELKSMVDEADGKTGHNHVTHVNRVPMRAFTAMQLMLDGVTEARTDGATDTAT